MAPASLEDRAIALVQGVRWAPERRPAEIVSILVAGALGLSIGAALAWSIPYAVLAAIALAASTWLARSLARAVICLLGAVGSLAAVFAGAVLISSTLLASLRITWTIAAVALWALTVAYAFLLGRVAGEREHGLAEIAGALIAIAAALAVWRKVDYSSDLLRLLVHVEDNEAWVAVITQVTSSDYIGPAFIPSFDGRGPVIATILGLLTVFQRADVPLYNAALSGWALAVLLTPVCAAALLRRLPMRSVLAILVFAAVTVAWAWHLPFLLFASYGHLTAVWAFLFLLTAAAALMFEPGRFVVVPVLAGVAFGAGATWYPIFPLGALILALVAYRVLRGEAGWRRIVGVAVATVAAIVLVLQTGQSVGLINAPDDVPFGIKNLYVAQGGTASLDGGLQLLVLIALVLLAAVPVARRPEGVDGLWRLMVVAVGYVAAVFAGAQLLKAGIGYGPTKVWLIVGFAVVVGLIAIVPRLGMPTRVVVAAALVLTLGSLIYGGAGAALSRTWPGGGTDPQWLVALREATQSTDPAERRPLACVSNDKYAAYLCTRWGAGMTTGSVFPYLGYRLKVSQEQDPTPEIDALIADGTVARSDVIVLDPPDEARAWAWPLIENAGRVLGPDGMPIDPRPTPPTGQ